MTRKEALEELIGKVEAGVNGRWTFDALGEDESGLALDAYHGSLDAAKALHEAVLHERTFVEIHWSKRYEDEARVTINMGEYGWHAGSAAPARAWLLAILRALLAQEPSE